MKRTLLCIFIFNVIFNSCAILHLTGKDEKSCQMHHNKAMKKSIVRVYYGIICPDHRKNTPDYPNARCVKCMGCIANGTQYQYAVIWTCATCTKLKHKNKREIG